MARHARKLQPPFAGFDRDAMRIWHELASEMSKSWFIENKQRYHDVWVAPVLALLEHAKRRLARVYEPYQLGTPGVLRIYRDVRFSRDKTPYKTHIAAILRFAGKPVAEAGTAVLYVEFGLDDEYVGVGSYRFDGPKLARWRKAVVGKPGTALRAIIAKLRKAGYAVTGH